MSDLRIVSWNCRKGLTDKAKALKTWFDNEKKWPDILVVQECHKETTPDFIGELERIGFFPKESSYPIGTCIFAKNGYKFDPVKPTSCLGKNLHDVFKFHVSGKINFDLFTVWTQTYECEKHSEGYLPYGYTGTILLALYEYMVENPSIVIGDFNTFSANNEDRLYQDLEVGMKKFSLKNCDTENRPTFFFRSTHSGIDDYCFASNAFTTKSFKVGDYDTWIKSGLSDHCPIIVDFDFK